jgi:site-specific recombinase XerD
MAKANFYLKNPTSKEDTLIYLFFSYNGQRLKYSTGETINPKYWNEKNQRAKKSLTGSLEKNGLLKRIDEEANKIYREAKTFGKHLTNEYFKECLEKELHLSGKGAINFFDYFDEFIELQKSFMSPKTILKYKGFKKHLINFQSKKRITVCFENIDSRFYEVFTSYSITDLHHVNNTITKHIKVLKTFMRWATERGYNKGVAFLKFKTPGRDADIMYLTQDELFTLYNKDLSDKPDLAKVRDTFCFGCFTGLRYSDILRVNKDNVKNGEINFVSEKTTEKINIPLNSYSEAILKKHKYSLPVLPNQKTNELLKELGENCGLKEPVIITRFRGAEEIQLTKPKYEFMGTHTARRTFVTLSLEKGMRAETVMGITGHKHYATFKKYIKITNKVKRVEMKQIWDNETPLLAVV